MSCPDPCLVVHRPGSQASMACRSRPGGSRSVTAAAAASRYGTVQQDQRPRSSKPSVTPEALAEQLSQKYGITVYMSGGRTPDQYVALSKIEVPKERRGEGIARKAMEEIVNEADKNGWKMSLTPSNTWGGSVPKLTRFYRSLGFAPNKGRNKDYGTKDTMLRPANG